MAQSNPFEIGTEGGTPRGDREEKLAEIGRYLRQTQPWMFFLAVLGLLGTLLTGGVGLMMMAIGGSITQNADFGPMRGFGALIGVFYLVIAALYLVPSVLMGRFGFAISRASTGDLTGIASAIRAQRDLWIFFGVTTLLFIALYCGGIVMIASIGTSLNSTFEEISDTLP